MHEQTLLQLIDGYFLSRDFRGTPAFIQDFHAYVLPCLKEMRLTKNMVLCTQHSIHTAIYFLVSGVAYAPMEHQYRKMLVSPFLWSAPAIIGDGKSFYKQKPARFGVALQGYARVYALERKELVHIEERYTKVRGYIRLAIKRQQQAFKIWESELLAKKVPDRFRALQETSPELLKHVQQKHVAAHLGIYEPYCSKLMRESDKKTGLLSLPAT